MLDKLPYQLTAGVTATREGLVFVDGTDLADLLFGTVKVKVDIYDESWLWRWTDVVERLRYRDGEPWVYERDDGLLQIGIGDGVWADYALHRISAILCDNAKAFRVLHWCVEQFGGER